MRMTASEFALELAPAPPPSLTKILFERAHALIKDKKHWCQGVLTRAALNGRHRPEVPAWVRLNGAYRKPDKVTGYAMQYCSLGAINEAGDRLEFEGYSRHHINVAMSAVQERIEWLTGAGMIAVYNDTHTHEQVMRVWRVAGQSLH